MRRFTAEMSSVTNKSSPVPASSPNTPHRTLPVVIAKTINPDAKIAAAMASTYHRNTLPQFAQDPKRADSESQPLAPCIERARAGPPFIQLPPTPLAQRFQPKSEMHPGTECAIVGNVRGQHDSFRKKAVGALHLDFGSAILREWDSSST